MYLRYLRYYLILLETLGEGCVGLVKKAVRKSDKQVFAVKTVRTRDEETIQNVKIFTDENGLKIVF